MDVLEVAITPTEELPESEISYGEAGGCLNAVIGPRRPCPRQVLVDSRIVFDVDESGEPYCIEVIWPKERWTHGEGYDVPTQVMDGRLFFRSARAGIDEEIYEDESRVFASTTSKPVYVRLIRRDGELRAVRIAPGVVADIRGECVCGFWLWLGWS